MSSAPGTLWVVRMVEERFHRDDEGRPLREGRTPREYLASDEIEYRPCPYPGSRQASGRPMNVSALRQTSVHWDEIVESLGFLRTAYAEARGGYGPDVMDLWRVSQLGSALPWFFVLAGEPLPGYAAALSKATLGTGILAQRLLLKMLAEAWAPPPLTTPTLVGLAESTGTLVGETEVCSASDKMIARFVDALVAGVPAGGVAAVDPLIAARDRVLGFGASYAAFKLAMWLYYQARRFLYADIAAARGPGAVRALVEAPCEPPDFFVIEPPDPAAVPPALRAAWLDQLANLIVPFAPDGSDRAVRDGARRIAAATADDAPDPIARAIAAFARLDAIWGDIVAAVEAGLRGAPCPAAIDAATRDRLVVTSPRAMFAALVAP
ncbi:MAG: hypothetical protein E6J90_36045 [Deltaproteobacteria bacterium]|nr:MAG: hypothetical protein E6J90_36045 [Deltaproteobacteria bacterium]TMQ17632.1 MAG: hypothetical protein E6J91_09655 [Deltaproteobacteria bacterium]